MQPHRHPPRSSPRLAALAALGLVWAFGGPDPLRAQALAEGYASTVQGLPKGAGNVLVPAGAPGVVYFTGTRLVWDSGQGVKDLLVFPSAVFGSFTIQIGPDDLLFGESKNGTVWKVALRAKRAPVKLATIRFNYDAVAISARHALVSAKTGGLSSPDNEILALDLRTGATDRVALVAGVSGPLAVDRHGNVYYATASMRFPPPPGQTRVLRFAASAVRRAMGPGHLTEKDAHLLHHGLDAGSDLAIDRDGDLFVVDWKNDRLWELSDATSGKVRRVSVLVDYQGAPVEAASVQDVARSVAGPGSFEPFQPAGPDALAVAESRFGGPSQLRWVRAARPATTAIPGGNVGRGPFSLTTRGGPRGGAGLLVLRTGARPAGERAFDLGFEQRLFFDPHLLRPTASVPIAFDRQGTHALHAFHPGLARPLPVLVQIAFLDAGRHAIGSAPPVAVTFR